MNYEVKTPILVIAYRKPSTTQVVFEGIKKVKPSTLYVALNAPKNDSELEACAATKKIFENPDWQCEVKFLERVKYLEITESATSAISWFFENEECGIILEDDCVPSESFFRFCDEMLERYRDDVRVAHICGANTLPEVTFSQDSYFFSRWPGIWGWATWRRTWDKFDLQMRSYKDFKKTGRIHSIFKNKDIASWMQERFEFAHSKYGNIWDYSYHYSVISNGGLCVTPARNLIKNIGFTGDATHTSNEPEYYKKIMLEELKFPLCHPDKVEAEEGYVNLLYEKVYKDVVERNGIKKLTKYIPLDFKIVLTNLARKLFGK